MSKYDDDDEFYNEGKYDDEGEGKYGGGEGKHSERDDADDGAVVLPPIVQAFAHQVMSKKFRSAVEKFFADNCRGFENVNLSDEHPLEWTQLYEDYVVLIEQQLEEFCRKHRARSEDIFLEVQDVTKSGELDDEFLPAILRVTEYKYFIEQITLTADRRALMDDASGDSKAADEDELTGVWKADTARLEHANLDKYLKATRVPFVFRGLAKGVFFSNKEVVISQSRQSISIISNSPFGMQKVAYELDDRARTIPNQWGKDVPIRAGIERNGSISITLCQPPSLPRGSEIVHTWGLTNGGRSLLCTMEVTSQRSSPVVFEMWYKRA